MRWPILLLVAAAACTRPAVAPPAVPPPPPTVLVASKTNAEVRLVDPVVGEVLATLPTGVGPHEIAVAPDGKRAVVANYGTKDAPGSTLTVVSLLERSVSGTIDLGEHRRPHGLAFLPDGRLLVTVEQSEAVLVVDVGAGKVAKVIKTHQKGTHMVVATRDGRRAYTANVGSGSVSLLDVDGGTVTKTKPVAPQVEALALLPDGRELWVGSNQESRVHVLDGATLDERGVLPAAGLPIRLAATPDGKQVIVSNAAAGKLEIVDAARRAVVATVDFPDAQPIGIAVDATTVYVSLAARGELGLVDLAAAKVRGVLPVGAAPDGIALWVKRG